MFSHATQIRPLCGVFFYVLVLSYLFAKEYLGWRAGHQRVTDCYTKKHTHTRSGARHSGTVCARTAIESYRVRDDG